MLEIIMHLFLTCLIGGCHGCHMEAQDAVQKLLAQWLSSSAELTSAASPSGKCTVMKKRKPDKTPARTKLKKITKLGAVSMGRVDFHTWPKKCPFILIISNGNEVYTQQAKILSVQNRVQIILGCDSVI